MDALHLAPVSEVDWLVIWVLVSNSCAKAELMDRFPHASGELSSAYP